MSDYCGATHPEDPSTTCRKPLSPEHEMHLGRDKAWANTEFSGMTVTERQARRPVGKRANQMNLAAFLGTRVTHTKQEGMGASALSIRKDPHNWQIVQECVRAACRTHEQVSTNEVWDELLRREDFTYTGDRGFMGTVLSGWARREGLVGEASGKIPNRLPWGHSTEPVNVYPSLVRTPRGE